MKSKEEILKNSIGMQLQFYTHSGVSIKDTCERIYSLALEYSDQQNAELLSEIEHLKGEQQVLVERLNRLTPYKKEGI